MLWLLKTAILQGIQNLKCWFERGPVVHAVDHRSHSGCNRRLLPMRVTVVRTIFSRVGARWPSRNNNWNGPGIGDGRRPLCLGLEGSSSLKVRGDFLIFFWTRAQLVLLLCGVGFFFCTAVRYLPRSQRHPKSGRKIQASVHLSIQSRWEL